jgi:hypothetical protein
MTAASDELRPILINFYDTVERSPIDLQIRFKFVICTHPQLNKNPRTSLQQISILKNIVNSYNTSICYKFSNSRLLMLKSMLFALKSLPNTNFCFSNFKTPIFQLPVVRLVWDRCGACQSP